jgi:peptidoglycan/xylan/chitin deacetylase (PgdA/CDA1 family)
VRIVLEGAIDPVSGQHFPGFGALVVSLDFELLWGVRDLYPADGGAYRQNLIGSRTAIPRMLDLFEEFGISATWATVGMAFAADRSEYERYLPEHRPTYTDPRLNPYLDQLGQSEVDDPLHYGASLVEEIKRRPRQEIASHTFSHYYCLEPGHDPVSFRDDLTSAVAIAKARGIELKSLVFPRNQFNPDYVQIMVDAGITNCRSNAGGWFNRESGTHRYRRADARVGRLVDGYVPVSGDQVTHWHDIPFVDSICCLPAGQLLRAYSPRLAPLDPLRFHRITTSLRKAAKENGIYHLWWHPHNAGVFTDEYLTFLRRILEEYRCCRDRYGMRSLTMAETAEIVTEPRLVQHAA